MAHLRRSRFSLLLFPVLTGWANFWRLRRLNQPTVSRERSEDFEELPPFAKNKTAKGQNLLDSRACATRGSSSRGVMQVTAFCVCFRYTLRIGGWRLRWERISKTQRIEEVPEHRSSPWLISKKSQSGFDQSSVIHPSIRQRPVRSLYEAPWCFDAPANNCRDHFATSRCL
jgi:hypothetical protein